MQEGTPEYEERQRSESFAVAYAAVECRLRGDEDGYAKWMGVLSQTPAVIAHGVHALADASSAATVRWAKTFNADPVQLWCALADILMNEHHCVPLTPVEEPEGLPQAPETAADHAKVMELVHAAVTARVNNHHEQVVSTVAELTATEQLGVSAVLTALEVVRGLVNIVASITGKPPAQVWSNWATTYYELRVENERPPEAEPGDQPTGDA